MSIGTVSGTVPDQDEFLWSIRPPFTPGGGPGEPVPDIARDKPKLEEEYVALSRKFGQGPVPMALPTAVDDITRYRDPDHYEWMMTDPVVSASVRALRLAILAGGMDLKATLSTKRGAQPTPEEKRADEMVKFCWRAVERCKGWNRFLSGILGAAAMGNKLAEKVFQVAPSGPDKGKLVWKAIKVKPRGAWQFVVDDVLNVLGVMFFRGDGTRAFLPREKVAILSWWPEDGDPRGTSVLRPAVGPHNLKRLLWPEFYAHGCQFGSASLVGTTAENPKPVPMEDEDGKPIPGAPLLKPERHMAGQLVSFQNGSVVVIPFGAKVEAIPPQGDGTVFRLGIEMVNQEIVQSILLQTRATTEAQYGSRADSQTGQDIMGLLVSEGRDMLAEMLREDCFRQLIALNFGQDTADEFTPLVTFGAEQQDRAAIWGAIAGLFSSGYLGQSQIEELDAIAGLPIRDVAADEAKKQEEMERSAKLAQVAKAPPGEDAEDAASEDS